MAQSAPDRPRRPRRRAPSREALLDDVRGLIDAPDFAFKCADFQEQVAEFGFNVTQAIERMDPTLRARYRKQIKDLAEDLIHLLHVKVPEVPHLKELEHSTILTAFLSFGDDDDDPEPEPERPKAPSDTVPA